jgi:hypothetical protein
MKSNRTVILSAAKDLFGIFLLDQLLIARPAILVTAGLFRKAARAALQNLTSMLRLSPGAY